MATLLRTPSALQTPFNPVWWAGNPHVQTIWASKFSTIHPLDRQHLLIPTPDDDLLELDVHHMPNTKGVAIIFHGLEGSANRHYVVNLMAECVRMGYSSVGVNFRTCGNELNRTRTFYHSGATYDYETVVQWAKQQFPDQPLFGIGFSLGGNALLKYLGEREDPGLDKAVAISAPFDLERGSLNLQKGVNQLYERHFLSSLVAKLNLKRKTYPDLPLFTGTTLYEFDDQITGPLHGFRDAHHYYSTCSSGQFLGSIDTPTLLIHSREDPLTPLEYAPHRVIEQNVMLETLFTKKGGHVGFIGKQKNWLNRTIVNWLISS
ncbi:MAG: alpha/beta fold hydrolase [Bacteroidota bacterium]